MERSKTNFDFTFGGSGVDIISLIMSTIFVGFLPFPVGGFVLVLGADCGSGSDVGYSWFVVELCCFGGWCGAPCSRHVLI